MFLSLSALLSALPTVTTLNFYISDVRSVGYSELLVLSKKALMSALVDYPEARKQLEYQAQLRISSNRKMSSALKESSSSKYTSPTLPLILTSPRIPPPFYSTVSASLLIYVFPAGSGKAGSVSSKSLLKKTLTKGGSPAGSLELNNPRLV